MPSVRPPLRTRFMSVARVIYAMPATIAVVSSFRAKNIKRVEEGSSGPSPRKM
jgi:hypothetical protein